jgi:hypothetical protein
MSFMAVISLSAPPDKKSAQATVADGAGTHSNDLLGGGFTSEDSPADRQRAARDLDQRIDQALGDAFELLATAFRIGAWVDLGFESWDAYLASKAEVARLRIPAAERTEVFGRFRDAGMSDRQIAAATGVGHATVSRSFAVSNETDVDHDVAPEAPEPTPVPGRITAEQFEAELRECTIALDAINARPAADQAETGPATDCLVEHVLDEAECEALDDDRPPPSPSPALVARVTKSARQEYLNAQADWRAAVAVAKVETERLAHTPPATTWDEYVASGRARDEMNRGLICCFARLFNAGWEYKPAQYSISTKFPIPCWFFADARRLDDPAIRLMMETACQQGLVDLGHDDDGEIECAFEVWDEFIQNGAALIKLVAKRKAGMIIQTADQSTISALAAGDPQ